MRGKMLTVLLLSLGLAGQAASQEASKTPMEVAQSFERHFNAGDVKALLGLYQTDSVFVAAPGTSMKGTQQIRSALEQFLAAKMPIHVQVRQIYATDRTALIISDWVLEGTDASGKAVRQTGTGADVVTKGPDGHWRYAVDNPFGVASPATH